jgi:hypothetical protein
VRTDVDEIVRTVPALAGFASLIVADSPALFAEIGGGWFPLLWRGSRDSFDARAFCGRCDGHAAMGIIRQTEATIFGGFTPMEWDSCTGWKADPSLESFLKSLEIWTECHNTPLMAVIF